MLDVVGCALCVLCVCYVCAPPLLVSLSQCSSFVSIAALLCRSAQILCPYLSGIIPSPTPVPAVGLLQLILTPLFMPTEQSEQFNPTANCQLPRVVAFVFV